MLVVSLLVTGCHHPQPKVEANDPELDLISKFIKGHAKSTSYGGVVMSTQEVTGIDSQGMSFATDIFRTGQPEMGAKSEYVFRWEQVTAAQLTVDKECAFLQLILKPQGIVRFYERSGNYWRRGPSPDAEFVFTDRGTSLGFYELVTRFAKSHGAKFSSNPLRVFDKRFPKPMTGAQIKRGEEDLKQIRLHPDFLDKVMPRERPGEGHLTTDLLAKS